MKKIDEIKLIEISLVKNPINPACVFKISKPSIWKRLWRWLTTYEY